MRDLDAHCDTLVRCYDHGEHLGENPFHLDLKRLSAYGPCGQIFAVWLDDRIYGTPEVGEQAWDYLCKVTAFAKEQQKRYPQWLQWCTNVQDWQEAKEQGRCAGILSLEGGHGLGGQLERVEQLYRMGFRIITLTWNDENLLACGCGAKRQGGLKPFGRQVLEKMKERGIEQLILYGDVEHGANFEYLVGYFTRFEEGLLVLDKDGSMTLVLGNENLNKASKARFAAAAVHVSLFSLPNQPNRSDKTLPELLAEAGIRPDRRTGIAGWKMFTSPVEKNKQLFDIPAFILAAIEQVVGNPVLLRTACGQPTTPMKSRIMNSARRWRPIAFWRR